MLPQGLAHAITVHPHQRGEHTGACGALRLCRGSSPPARGTFIGGVDELEAARFIPTSAGNMSPAIAPPNPEPVHPHQRGEHSSIELSAKKKNGSSPPARGTSRWRLSPCPALRFIPTSAGNIGISLPSWMAEPVHPHQRGEHQGLKRLLMKTNGSSPPARGTLTHTQGSQPVVRFIPTSAGNICWGTAN